MGLTGQLEATSRDGGIAFAFTVTNDGADPVSLDFESTLFADFATFEDGREIWRWSSGRAFAQTIVTETLEPGGSMTRTATWSNPPPGAYAAVATLRASNHRLERTASVTV